MVQTDFRRKITKYWPYLFVFSNIPRVLHFVLYFIHLFCVRWFFIIDLFCVHSSVWFFKTWKHVPTKYVYLHVCFRLLQIQMFCISYLLRWVWHSIDICTVAITNIRKFRSIRFQIFCILTIIKNAIFIWSIHFHI